MYHVLLPVDSNEDRATRAAEFVASLPDAADGARVTVLHVEQPVDVPDAEMGALAGSQEWSEGDDVPASVDAATAVLEEAGIRADVRRERADPSRAIVEVATEAGADQIVVHGQKQTPVGKVLFGSVTQSVLLDADVPVTVIPA